VELYLHSPHTSSWCYTKHRDFTIVFTGDQILAAQPVCSYWCVCVCVVLTFLEMERIKNDDNCIVLLVP